MALEPGTQVEVEGWRSRQQVARRLALPTFILGWIAIACAPSAAQKIEADMASVRKESDAKTLVERGKAFAAIGDHTRAEEYLASGIEAGADPRDVLPLLMDVCVKTGRYRSAIQHGENHLRKHPHDMRTRVMVGALYAAINESSRAKAQLEQVVKVEPDTAMSTAPDAGGQGADPSATGPVRLQAQAHYLLAVVARDNENDVVGADRHFREYLKIEPNGSHAEEARASLLKRVPNANEGTTRPQPQTDGDAGVSGPPTPLGEKVPGNADVSPEGGTP
jgi:tetratricopeptide (TPR) repeat protein